MSEEQHDLRDDITDERGASRLEAFSDGVIAVAITLLILDVHVPDPKVLREGSLLVALGQQWASYLGYVTSFLIIGIYWANHHLLFKYIKRTDHFFLLINTLFLMCIALVPFGTSLLTTYMQQPDPVNEYIAAVTYSGILLLSAITFSAVWLYASRKHRLLRLDLNPHIVQRITRGYLIGSPLYLLSLISSLVDVRISLALYILVALVYSWPVDRVSFRKRTLEKQGVEATPGS
jgi:uncharacterized membrane protein